MLKKTILIIFMIIMVNLLPTYSLLPTLQELIQGNAQQNQQQENQHGQQIVMCNKNGVCNFDENNLNCPSDCPIEVVNQSTNEQVNIPIQKQNRDMLQNTYKDNNLNLNKLILMSFSILFIILILAIGFWIYGNKRKKQIVIKKKEEKTQLPFGLPPRPQRKFGI